MQPPLTIHAPANTDPVETLGDIKATLPKKAAPLGVQAMPPLLAGRKAAAAACDTSCATWDRWTSAALNPAPRRILGRPFWSIPDLALWVDLGCPDRKTFEALKAARNGSGQRREGRP
ncbi:hypothetical protein AYO44_13155 [Planctomycetaceae bacterium SCGC AG-212-F19]|nr:hypothetical protein AYO44_13155 [Planctomycetaceae bacterium SCGC AG-212-F19]